MHLVVHLVVTSQGTYRAQDEWHEVKELAGLLSPTYVGSFSDGTSSQ